MGCSVSRSLSAAAYAERRGVSHVAVLKAIKEGRITAKKVGRAYKIDPDLADRQWEHSTSDFSHGGASNADTQVRGPSYSQSRAIKEAYAAKLKKLEYEEATGKLVDAEQVALDFANVAAIVQQKMRTIPVRIAAQVLACTTEAEARSLLSREIDIALSSLADGFTGDDDED
jgi:hypothetical protein